MKHLLISGGMAFASRRMLLAILLCCSFARGYDYNFFTRCPPGWSTASGTTCFKAFCDQKSWFDAQVACKASNGVLARVSSPKDSQLVRYLMQGAQSFWIGCNSRERKEGEFVWAGYGGSACIGPFASYTNWHQGQPDNIGREMQSIGHAEQCVNVGKMGDEDSFWYNSKCCTLLPYVCSLDIHNIHSSRDSNRSAVMAERAVCERVTELACQEDNSAIVGFVVMTSMCCCCVCGCVVVGYCCLRSRHEHGRLEHQATVVILMPEELPPPHPCPSHGTQSSYGQQYVEAPYGQHFNAQMQYLQNQSEVPAYSETAPPTAEHHGVGVLTSSVDKPDSPEGLQGEWIQVADPHTGNMYEYNTASNETRWVTKE